MMYKTLALLLVFSANGIAAGQELRPLVIDGRVDKSAQGIWQSVGYGWTARIDGSDISLYHHAEAGCIPDPATSEELKMLIGYFGIADGKLQISARQSGSTIYTFHPIQEVPKACAALPSDTPQAVFDYFWGVMNEHYAFFDLYEVDWAARRDQYAAQVHADMSDTELFDALSAMLDGLHDGHLGLHADIDGETKRFRAARTRVLGRTLDTAFANQKKLKTRQEYVNAWYASHLQSIKDTILGKQHEEAADGNVIWGRVGQQGRVGYLAVFGMGGFADEDVSGMKAELAAVDDVMTRAMTDLSDTEALIIDITLNQGGMDEVGFAIASFFADQKTLGHTKTAHRADGLAPHPTYIEPTDTAPYLKPVAVLTSDVTISAAETFTMGMRALPHVTHVGDVTFGALSDVLEKTLPNGWELLLSNEVYLDAEGILWEGIGITPERPLTIWDASDLFDSHRKAIMVLAEDMAKD